MAIFFIAFFAVFSEAEASLMDDLKARIEQKTAEIKKLEERAQKYREEINSRVQISKTLKNELARIEQTIKQTQNDIKITERKLEKIRIEIEQTGLEIGDTQSSISKLQGGLSEIMRAMAANDEETPLLVLLKYKSLGTFFQKADYANLLQSQMLDTLAEMHELQEDLREQKVRAEEKENTLQSLEKRLKDQKKITEQVKSQKNNLLIVTKNQEKKYQEMLTAAEKQQQELFKELEALEEEQRKLIDPNSLPKTASNFFLWPVKGVISQGYGETPFTNGRGRDFYQFHNGIDIAASVGTPIVAPADGAVLTTGNTDSYCLRGAYGRYIVMDHRNNLATMYAHLSLISVSNGEEVKRGDIIGYVGNTGLSTGPHLHFTVYDRQTLQVKRVATGACGPLPTGGSVNPLNYL